MEACQRKKMFGVEFEVQKRRKRKSRALSFVLRSPWFCQGVKFDVLPAFDALAKHSQSQGISVFILGQGFFLSFFLFFMILSRNLPQFKSLLKHPVNTGRS